VRWLLSHRGLSCAKTTKLLAPLTALFLQATLDTLVGRALERRILEQVLWTCLCDSEEQFHTVIAFDNHTHDTCPERRVDCRWYNQTLRDRGKIARGNRFPLIPPPPLLFAPRLRAPVMSALLWFDVRHILNHFVVISLAPFVISLRVKYS
jgi:hypothetical protein